MRIENITSESLEGMSDAELRYLRSRCLNIYDRYFAESDVQKAVGIDRRWFLTKYLLLRSEMENRSIKLFRERPLDVEVHNRIFKTSIWKLDVPAMGDMIAIPNYVSVCGEFVQSPVSVEKIDVVIRTAKEHRNEAFEEKISTLIKEQTNKELNIIYEPKGPGRTFIPLFDLVLKSHDETRKVKKLTTTERIECDAETVRIKENEKLPLAKEPHEFKAAKFTHPNGHPRCLICGDEEPVGKACNMPDVWYEKFKWDDEEAWTEERKKLKANGKLKKSLASDYSVAIKKPEESETTIRIPVGPDCEVTATITIDKAQGIQALYCGKIKKVRTFLFDKRVKTWTMASARAWIKEQKEKTEKALQKGGTINKKKAPTKKKESTTLKILKVDKAQQIVGGVVYEPDEVDTQGDFTDAKEIEKAMYKFMERYATDSKRIRINHQGKKYHFPIMEVFQAEGDSTKKGGQILKAGTWWLEIKVTNDKIWEMIKNNEVEAFSMGGHSKARA